MKLSLTFMAVCVVFLAALGDIGNTLAQQTTVEIYGYTHGGCSVTNQVYLPTYAGDTKTARFRLPAGRQQCHDMINRAQTSCEYATDFQSTNPQGRPWKPGEKYPGCLRIFRDEIPRCRDHYESQRHKCDQQAISGSGGVASTGAAGLDLSKRRRLQAALAAAGFDPGPADGVFGAKTKRALQAWQQAKGHAATGELTGVQVEALLGAASPLVPFGPNWIIVENQPCQLYIPHPTPGLTATWSGGCVDGKAFGEGRSVWRSSSGEGTYAGGMREGKVHGRGTLKYASGSRYEGEWREGKRHGHGTFTWANGDRYEGEWREDKAHGRGTSTWANGDRYEGEWHDDRRHGHGTFTWPNGNRYEGAWHDDRAHGYGIVQWDGRHYRGQWRNGCSGRDGEILAAVGVTLAACGFK